MDTINTTAIATSTTSNRLNNSQNPKFAISLEEKFLFILYSLLTSLPYNPIPIRNSLPSNTAQLDPQASRPVFFFVPFLLL